MDEQWAARMKADEGHLRAVAYRMLGSRSDAEDAVQETWLRLSRADTRDIDNVRGWLTTVTARICLDMLRSRKSRREELGAETDRAAGSPADAEAELVLADSVGLALLVVLETLPPAERIAFVLHDMFDVPFDEIAPIVERSEEAARQLASRARRKVQGTRTLPEHEVAPQRAVVEAFLAAARGGDLDGLIAILDPDVVLRSDRVASRTGQPTEVRGARAIATPIAKSGARAARAVLVDGQVGVVVAPGGKLLMVLRYTVENGKIVAIDATGDRAAIDAMEIALLPE